MPDGSPAAKPRFRLAIVYVANPLESYAADYLTFCVLHSGGGIAGLTLAVALGHFEQASSPIQVDLYESGPEITTVGAGISVWPRTWAVMRALGLYDQLASQAVKAADAEDGALSMWLFIRSTVGSGVTVEMRRTGICVSQVGLAS